jgi:hypothetical protein
MKVSFQEVHEVFSDFTEELKGSCSGIIAVRHAFALGGTWLHDICSE